MYHLSFQNMCTHQISISNFSNQECITYPLIKIIGNISSESCHNCFTKTIRLYRNEKSTPFLTHLLNNHFKFLCELDEGRNDLKLEYCKEIFVLSVNYVPLKSEFAVIPLYVICEGHDGRFQAPTNEDNSVESACKRITLCAKLLQSVTAEKLFENTFDRKTFHLENHCNVFRSKLHCKEARAMSQEQLWKSIGNRIV